MNRWLLVAAALAYSAPAVAQQDEAGPMQKLARMVGTWEGEWTMTRGPGQPERGRITETVQSRQDGKVLLIEGEGRADEPGGRLIHDALGIIHHDAGTGRYLIRAYREGQAVDSELAVEEDGLEWGFDDPRAGRVRYRVTLDADAWHEIGEFSRDGTTWTRFMEMTLARVR